MKSRVAVLTGGGDCPGLNSVIRAVVKKSMVNGFEVLGLLDGWEGLLEKRYRLLGHNEVSGIIHLGGTILRTSRTNVLKDEATIQKALKGFEELKLDALIAVGGEGTLTVSSKLFDRGMRLVGVPKTIDNDINVTDFTVGFNTAVEIATEAIDRLRTTAESHKRVMVVEVMGRHAGWIAAYSGMAGGADAVIVPEYSTRVEDLCETIRKRLQRGKNFAIVVIAEGAKLSFHDKEFTISKDRKDAFGRPQLGGIGQALSNLIEDEIGIECRVTVLGHVQRGGTPTAWDRVIGTRLGSFAADLVRDKKWGHMAAFIGNHLEAVPLAKAVGNLKGVDEQTWEVLQSFVGET
jgi:ATP-dependent phosphofructokinase / diphosphate-dependent phosphofructokinase